MLGFAAEPAPAPACLRSGRDGRGATTRSCGGKHSTHATCECCCPKVGLADGLPVHPATGVRRVRRGGARLLSWRRGRRGGGASERCCGAAGGGDGHDSHSTGRDCGADAAGAVTNHRKDGECSGAFLSMCSLSGLNRLLGARVPPRRLSPDCSVFLLTFWAVNGSGAAGRAAGAATASANIMSDHFPRTYHISLPLIL